jgi:hypothetical protein
MKGQHRHCSAPCDSVLKQRPRRSSGAWLLPPGGGRDECLAALLPLPRSSTQSDEPGLVRGFRPFVARKEMWGRAPWPLGHSVRPAGHAKARRRAPSAAVARIRAPASSASPPAWMRSSLPTPTRRLLGTSCDRLRARCLGARFEQAKRKQAPRRPGRPVFVRGRGSRVAVASARSPRRGGAGGALRRRESCSC